ncbi:glucose PTS transporter subunit IIA [uncultured Pluralibacter sp.]|uniref:PTS sugar transporter subunit IIA n=1 Tax=uncultured Pluralibacter sp. TaxID=1490864 RepID=UPI002601E97D|nr:glucose PTS transporter subunit IIA [uncultured Pluralibacter sp.]
MTSSTTAVPLTSLYAPVSGIILELEKVNDVIFSEKLVGVGIAVCPDEGECNIRAPADGTIVNILPGNHAFFMKTDQNIELLVHYGLNTVSLNGDGFTRVAGPGQRVRRGDVILQVDPERLKKKGISTVTPVIIMSPEHYSYTMQVGKVCAGVDPIIYVRTL